MHTSFIPRGLPPYHPGPLWPGDPSVIFNSTDAGANIKVLLHAPALIVTLPYDFFAYWYPELRAEFIGNMAWLDAPLTASQYNNWSMAIIAALAGALFGQGQGARRWRMSDALFVLAIIAATVIAICLAVYLSWTAVGATMIEGVQARYLLPLVPFLPLILPRLGALVQGHKWLAQSAALIEIASVLPAVVLACYDITALPALMHARFG